MTHFFSCDWGTTSFRLRRVNAVDGTVLSERREASGAKVLFSTCPSGDASAREKVFANFLREQLLAMAVGDSASLNCVPVFISGMASSSVGWRELPYARLPVGLDGSSIQHEEFDLDLDGKSRARIHLISGVRSVTDVMRGEETEICGLFAGDHHANIANDGIVVLPGTHSKQVRLQNHQITGFHTYMTGELFDVLASHSLLRASVQTNDGGSTLSEPASHESFVAGVRAASAAGLARSLFQTRTRTLLQNISLSTNRWFLSGLLIGSEVADLAAREPDAPILLAATQPQSAAYRLAFETLGLARRLSVVPPEEMATASVRGHLVMLQRNLNSTK